LLATTARSYPKRYWQRKTLSPSGVLIFLGINKKIPALKHHNSFFDSDWHGHFNQVFKKRTWSPRPLFYIGAPSKTDATVAPKGSENLFVLAPMANGVVPTDDQLDELVESIIARIESHTGTNIQDNIVVREIKDARFFEETFNAYKGNAFGLAHTLRQTAMFRPSISSKKVKNLFYAGQYTNPGTGVPMVVLSGKLAARLAIKESL
jgi:phytoene desaturase